MELLRKKDVIDQVGVAKSTVSDWINEYHMYIPAMQDGNKTYYRPETVDVLKTVKDLRDRDVSKTQIAEELAKRFPINADDTAAAIQNHPTDKTDAMIAVMSTMGKVIEQLGRQDERIREQDEKLTEMAEEVAKVSEYESTIDELRKQIAASQEKSQELEVHIKALQEEKSKGFWGKLFGGK